MVAVKPSEKEVRQLLYCNGLRLSWMDSSQIVGQVIVGQVTL